MAERTINIEIEKIIDEYVKEIQKNYKVEMIILFGSYAKGTQTEDSDIDIAIIMDDFQNDVIDEQVNLMWLRRNIDFRIEPHLIRTQDYKTGKTPLAMEVMRTGIKVA